MGGKGKERGGEEWGGREGGWESFGSILPWQQIDIDAPIKVKVSRFNGVSVKKFTAETYLNRFKKGGEEERRRNE